MGDCGMGECRLLPRNTELVAIDFCAISGLRGSETPAVSVFWLSLWVFCLRRLERRQKNTRAMMPIRTIAPPTVPPAIAPMLVFFAVGSVLDVDVGSVVGIALVADRGWATNEVPKYLAKSGVAQPTTGAVEAALPSTLSKLAILQQDVIPRGHTRRRCVRQSGRVLGIQ